MRLTGQLMAALAFLPICQSALAQAPKPVVASRWGVDVVSLKSGKSLRGIILHQADDGALTMAVPREWFRKSHPELFAKTTEKEAELERKASEQLRDRIKALLVAPPDA